MTTEIEYIAPYVQKRVPKQESNHVDQQERDATQIAQLEARLLHLEKLLIPQTKERLEKHYKSGEQYSAMLTSVTYESDPHELAIAEITLKHLKAVVPMVENAVDRLESEYQNGQQSIAIKQRDYKNKYGVDYEQRTIGAKEPIAADQKETD